MHIAVVGDSRGTGAQLARLALKAGHQVTVVSRSGGGPDGARRLLVQSSLGVGASARHMPPVLRGLMRLVLASALADHTTQEEVVRGSGLEWTVVRPTGLTDKPATGTWRAVEESQEGTLGGTVPRADLAAFALGLLKDPGAVGKAFSVSS